MQSCPYIDTELATQAELRQCSLSGWNVQRCLYCVAPCHFCSEDVQVTGVLTQDCAGAVARRDCGGGHPSGRCLRRRVQADLGRWLVRTVPLNNDSSSMQIISSLALLLAVT